MGLLQDPIKALEQAEWYLEQNQGERFPGAYELAAGNLCRQTLEQILFIPCFYSGMPRKSYFRVDRTLQTAGRLLKELDQFDPTTHKSYWELARRRGPRIRKFARQPRVLRAWQRKLNEPSHFSLKFRAIGADRLKAFVSWVRQLFDTKDKYLIVAAVNELFSNGRFCATLSTDLENTPGISMKAVIGPKHLERDEHGHLALRSSFQGMQVISDTEIPRGPWPRQPVLVQHSVGIILGIQFVTRDGTSVDISNTGGILASLARTSGQRAALTRRLRELGFEITWRSR